MLCELNQLRLDWDSSFLCEQRACLILSIDGYRVRRFGTDFDCQIMYASPICQQIVGVPANVLTGCPLLDFAVEHADLESRLKLVQSCETICRLRFHWSINRRLCEAVMTYSTDGIVCILRRAPNVTHSMCGSSATDFQQVCPATFDQFGLNFMP